MDYHQNLLQTFLVIYKLILGNADPYDEYESPIQISLILFYVLASLLLVIIMLNLLIAIVSDTNEKVSSMNELIYEKNRVHIIAEYYSYPQNKNKMTNLLKDKYLINVYNKNSRIFKEKLELLEKNEEKEEEFNNNEV
jgi:hypothetical protein